MDVLAEAVGEVEEARELQEDEYRVARQAGADPPLVQLILRKNIDLEFCPRCTKIPPEF